MLEEEGTSLLERAPRNSIWIFLPYLLLQVSDGLCASIQSTIYPLESSKKGLTASQIGPEVGIFFLSQIIVCPLTGRWLSVWGAKKLYPAGFILAGGTSVLFGLLQWVSDPTLFLVFSYLLRFLGGVGSAVLFTSNLAILLAKFPDLESTVMAWCQASYNFGLAVGPILGLVAR